MVTICAYITNPIVVLFANEYGELPEILKWWQTPDNPLDVKWVIHCKCVPDCICYDYDRHYKYISRRLTYNKRGFVLIVDPHFTLKERIQRYFCRLYWVYKHTAYGFSYYVTGKVINGPDMYISHHNSSSKWISYETTKSVLSRAWSFYYHKVWCKKFSLCIYLGWKAKGIGKYQARRCMLALYISPFVINRS